MNKLQKIIAIGTALTTIITMSGLTYFTPVASAKTAAELETEIAALMESLNALKLELANLEGTPATTYEGIPADFQFTKLLKKGSKGDEVKYLQIILREEVGEDVVGKADGSFGKKTDAAVKTFQTDNDLTADGIVGSKSRAALNALLAAAPVVNELTVASISPASNATSVAVGSNVTVTLSMALDTATVTADSVKLTAGTTAVIATTTVSDKVITIDPTANLAENTTYTVALTTAVKATDGTALKAAYSSSFSTGTTVTPPPVTGGLTVELASDTPAAGIVPLASLGVPYTKIKLTGAGKVSQIIVKRTGLGHKDDFAGVTLYEGDVKLTLSRTLSSDDTVTFNLSTPIEVVSGTAKYITVAGDIVTTTSGSTTAASGNVDVLEVNSVTADATVNGTFPIVGKPMSLGAVKVGQLKAEQQTTSDVTVNVGEQNQEMGRFRFTAVTSDDTPVSSSEDIDLKAVRFRQFGSANVTDLINLKLYKNTEELTVVTVTTSGDYITFSNIGITLTKGNYVTLVVKADVISGGGQTIRLQIEEPSDVNAQGKTYKYGVYVHDGDTTWTAANLYGTQITLAAGELTFSITGPSAQTVTTKQDNIVAANITIVAVDASLVTRIYGSIDGTDDADPATTMDNTIENVRLQKADGSITHDAVAGTDDDDDNYEFSFANVDVPKGTSEWKILFNTVDSATDAGDSYQFALNASASAGTSPGSESLSAITAKNSQGKAISDVKPGAVVTGFSVTLGGAALTVVKLSMDTTTVVGNTKGTQAIKLQITAGSADSATITQMVFENGTASDALGSTELSNFTLEQIYPTTTVLQTGVAASAATATFTVTFNSINSGKGLVVPAGTYIQVTVKFDTNSPSAITNGHIVALKASNTDFGITAQNSAGDAIAAASITDGDGTTNLGRQVILSADGQLTITKENVLTDQQVLGGTTGVNTLKLKFKAEYEGVSVTKMVIDCDANNDGVEGDNVAAVHLYDGATKITSASFNPATGVATFGDGVTPMFTAPKDLEKILTVQTDFRGVGLNEETADSNDTIVWVLDHGDGGDLTVVTAIGASSNAPISLSATYASSEILIGGDADVTANTFLVRRAMISKIAGNESYTDKGTLLSSGATGFKVFAFTITPASDLSGKNYDAAIDLRGLKLTVSGGGDLSSTALASVVIYRADVPGVAIAASTATTTYLQWNDDALANLTNIKPGDPAATFIVKATLPTAGYSTADTLQISIAGLGDSTDPTAVLFADGALVWADRDSAAGGDSDWIGYAGIDITDVKGPLFTGPQT